MQFSHLWLRISSKLHLKKVQTDTVAMQLLAKAPSKKGMVMQDSRQYPNPNFHISTATAESSSSHQQRPS